MSNIDSGILSREEKRKSAVILYLSRKYADERQMLSFCEIIQPSNNQIYETSAGILIETKAIRFEQERGK